MCNNSEGLSDEFVGNSDLLDPDYLAYMLKYDSVHGKFEGDIAVEGSLQDVGIDRDALELLEQIIQRC